MSLNETDVPTLSPTFEQEDLRPVDIFLQALFPFLIFSFVTMMTASVDTNLLLSKFMNKGIVVGLFIQFLISPLIGFITVKIPFFGDSLSAPDKVILLAILSSPGGTFSNVLCSLFNADLALSVTMSAVSTLASALFLPLNLFLYVTLGLSSDDEVKIDFVELSYTIIAVELGTLVGIFVGKRYKEEHHQNIFNLTGVVLSLIMLFVSTTLSQSEENITEKSLGFIIACVFPVSLLACLGILLSTLAGIEKPERLAVAVESSYQNTGIAISVAFATFELNEARKAVNVTIANGFAQFIISYLVLYIGYKAGWSYSREKVGFCRAITKNLQPTAEEEKPESSGKYGTSSVSFSDQL